MDDRLKLISDAIEMAKKGTFSFTVVKWLVDGIEGHIRTGQSLDQLLGLATPDKSRNLRTMYLLQKRNDALYKAWQLCGQERLNDFAERVAEFYSDTWQKFKGTRQLPEQFDEVDRALFLAFGCGEKSVPVPTSSRRLHDAIKQGICEKL